MLGTAVGEAFLVGICVSTSSCCSRGEIVGTLIYFYLGINFFQLCILELTISDCLLFSALFLAIQSLTLVFMN